MSRKNPSVDVRQTWTLECGFCTSVVLACFTPGRTVGHQRAVAALLRSAAQRTRFSADRCLTFAVVSDHVILSQGPESDVQLIIPKDMYCTIVGTVHTDTKQFHPHIPEHVSTAHTHIHVFTHTHTHILTYHRGNTQTPSSAHVHTRTAELYQHDNTIATHKISRDLQFSSLPMTGVHDPLPCAAGVPRVAGA